MNEANSDDSAVYMYRTRFSVQLTTVIDHCVTTYNGCFLLIKVFALMLFVFLFNCKSFTLVIEGHCTSSLFLPNENFMKTGEEFLSVNRCAINH